MLGGKKLKIFRTEKEIVEHDEEVGKFVSNNKSVLKIATQDGFLKVLELQLQGRKRMKVKDFLNGYKF